MADTGTAKVRLFGSLYTYRRQHDQPAETIEEVPEQGISAEELAERMGLPVDTIEGVFCDHDIYDLGHIIKPGNEVAFVPYGTPGPHRYYLGLYKAGHRSHDKDAENTENAEEFESGERPTSAE